MYKAIKEIGGYSVGEVVPDSKAEAWLEMYTEPHVEKFDGKTPQKEDSEVTEEESESLSGVLNDYLARNQSVVRKNVLGDNLSKVQLDQLLTIEESDKKRPLIINAIKHQLKG